MFFILMIFVLLLLACAGMFYAFTSNVMQRNMRSAREKWNILDAGLKRRMRTVTDMIDIVRPHLGPANDLLKVLGNVRLQCTRAENRAERNAGERALGKAVIAVIRAEKEYPSMQEDEKYQKIKKLLRVQEEQIRYARRVYNGAVRNINILIEEFPTSTLSGSLGMKPQFFFEYDDPADKAAATAKFV